LPKELRKWLDKLGTKTLYIEPGRQWENGYCESFNGKLGDEFLNGEIFYSLKEAQILTERWRVDTTRSVRTRRWATALREPLSDRHAQMPTPCGRFRLWRDHAVRLHRAT
jgi:transposase InsO family protein